jgi:AdoMet-dependent heme synthase
VVSREAKLPVQVSTTVTRHNLHDLDNLVELLKSLKIVLWSVFFLVPTGRGQVSDLLSPEEHEGVFAKLYSASKRVCFHIKTTEGGSGFGKSIIPPILRDLLDTGFC